METIIYSILFIILFSILLVEFIFLRLFLKQGYSLKTLIQRNKINFKRKVNAYHKEWHLRNDEYYL